MRRNQRRRSFYGYVYIIKNNDLYKIGFATDLHRRLAQLRTGAPHIEQVHAIRTIAYRQLESQLHYHFRSKRVTGEWFTLTEEDLDYIASLDSMGLTPNERRERDLANKRYWAEYKLIEAAAAAVWTSPRVINPAHFETKRV